MHKYFRFNCFLIFITWTTLVLAIFNLYFEDILNFNAKFRNFVINGKFSIHEVNNEGIPISFSPRIGKFVSPFYVVNYGIFYSEVLIDKEVIKRGSSFCWKKDKSLSLWPFYIKKNEINIKKLRNSADWIVRNVKYINGGYHLIYNFDWPYKKYKYSLIKAPWWSGLTDAYAIILLIRAYDIFGDKKYLNYANLLYRSTIKEISQGGSLTYLNGYPWIEEYVDYSHPKDTPKVLNGMIYSYFGIRCFEERYLPNKRHINKELLVSIQKNINVFDMGLWSYYDAIGTVANVKYHKIHVALISQLEKEGAKNFSILKWNFGDELPILWLLYGDVSFSKIHILVEIAFFIIFPLIVLCKRISLTKGN